MAHVTVANLDQRIQYAVTTPAVALFTIPAEWGFFALTDIKAYNGATALTYAASPSSATEYSVAGNAADGGFQGGTITIGGGGVTNTTITLVNEPPIERLADFPYPSPTLNTQALNTDLDKFAAWCRLLLTRLNRAVRLSDSDATAMLVLPEPAASRANKLLGFGAAGDTMVVNSITPNTTTVSAFGASLVDDPDAATARATLGIAGVASDSDALAGVDDTKILSIAKAGGWLGRSLVPGGRLTLTTALPVTTADVTAAGTVYYTPYAHNLAQLWNGTRWQVYSFAELSLVLEAAQQLSGKNYDVFLFDLAGALTLGTGPAWTNDTTRADAIARKDGRWTNNASITIRTNGTTTAVAANKALYVGTIRMTANAQTEDSAAKRFVWNVYNRVRRSMRNATETANSWTYATTTIRQANANAANQLDFVVGLAEDVVDATVIAFGSNTNSAPFYTGVGLDSTTAFSADSYPGATIGQTTHQPISATAMYRGIPGIGRRFLAWLELPTSAGVTQTWYGDNNTPTTLQSGISGSLFG